MCGGGGGGGGPGGGYGRFSTIVPENRKAHFSLKCCRTNH